MKKKSKISDFLFFLSSSKYFVRIVDFDFKRKLNGSMALIIDDQNSKYFFI